MALGEYVVEAEIVIGRSPEDVFAFVADSENDPQWCHLVPDVVRVGETEAGLPRYRYVQLFGPMRSEGRVAVESMSPPSEFRSTTEAMGGTFKTVYTLTPSTGGTVFNHVNQVSWSGGMRLMHPVQKVMTRRIMNRQLAKLKSILESE